MRAPEVGIAEIGATEIRTDELDVIKVDPAEIGIAQIRVAEVRSVLARFPKTVPFLDSSSSTLEQLESFATLHVADLR